MVLSPGVPPAEFHAARARLAPDARVHGEMSLSLAIAAHRWGRLPTVLITGTNGKSTVTALTGALLASAGKRPFVGGNLGVPLATALGDALANDEAAPDSLVLECSSFQLETLGAHPTDVAMILNLTPDHLDRYATMTEYARTKAHALAGLVDDGLALFDGGDPWTPFFRELVPRGRIVMIDGAAASDLQARIYGPGPGDSLELPGGETYPRNALRLAGRHNSKNALFALTAARHLGASREACLAGLAGFEGLPHRMVHVRELGGVAYYDDSKATNVASVLASLDGFDRRVVLIAGGRAKGDELGPLRELLARGGRGLVAIGEATETFYRGRRRRRPDRARHRYGERRRGRPRARPPRRRRRALARLRQLRLVSQLRRTRRRVRRLRARARVSGIDRGQGPARGSIHDGMHRLPYVLALTALAALSTACTNASKCGEG